MTGRDLPKLETLVREITASGAHARAAQVDALVEDTIERQADDVVRAFGRIDISFNAIGIPQQGIQRTPLIELSRENFSLPVTIYSTSHFLTAWAAARRMVSQSSGVILTRTATPSRLAAPFVGGMPPAWSAVEALTRILAAELGPRGIRVVCLRPDGIPEIETIGVVFRQHAKAHGIGYDDFLGFATQATVRKKLPTLAEVASAAGFLASNQASAITGTVANLGGGSIVD